MICDCCKKDKENTMTLSSGGKSVTVCMECQKEIMKKLNSGRIG